MVCCIRQRRLLQCLKGSSFGQHFAVVHYCRQPASTFQQCALDVLFLLPSKAILFILAALLCCRHPAAPCAHEVLFLQVASCRRRVLQIMHHVLTCWHTTGSCRARLHDPVVLLSIFNTFIFVCWLGLSVQTRFSWRVKFSKKYSNKSHFSVETHHQTPNFITFENSKKNRFWLIFHFFSTPWPPGVEIR